MNYAECSIEELERELKLLNSFLSDIPEELHPLFEPYFKKRFDIERWIIIKKFVI